MRREEGRGCSSEDGELVSLKLGEALRSVVRRSSCCVWRWE